MSFFKKEYQDKILPNLKEVFSVENSLKIPRLTKITLNIAFKTSDSDSNFLKYVVDQLSLIAGQKAVLVKAKKSVASFKLREDSPIACIVTLRGDKMYEFLDRLIFIALPRIRDFRGISGKGFNQSSHYSFGIKDHTIFPEISLDKAYKVLGMNINFVTSSNDLQMVKELLLNFKLPLK